MFTWICPKCGREVPPSYDDCPNCAATSTTPGAPAPAATPAAPPYNAPPSPPQQAAYAQPAAPVPQYAAPQAAYAPPPPPAGYAQAPYGYPATRRKMPEWLVMVLVAIGSVGLFALAYFYLLPAARKTSATAAAPAERTAPAAGEKEHPYAKFLDVTGIRVIEDARQNVQIKFLVVNHSPAEMAGVNADVVLKPVNAKPETPPVTEFSFKVPTLGPYESREVTVPAKTKLRAYEMPDWQFMQSEVHITSPK